MRKVKWLLAAGLLAATAACTAETGPYGSSYGYPSTAYNSGYYSNGVYYSNNTAYNRGYYAPSNSGYYAPSSSSYASSVPRRGPNGDYDRDGIPNRYDRDANGDGIPDRYQR